MRTDLLKPERCNYYSWLSSNKMMHSYQLCLRNLQAKWAMPPPPFRVWKCLQMLSLKYQHVAHFRGLAWDTQKFIKTLCYSSDPFSVPRISRLPSAMRNPVPMAPKTNPVLARFRKPGQCKIPARSTGKKSGWLPREPCLWLINKSLKASVSAKQIGINWFFLMEICSTAKYWTVTQLLLTLSAIFPENIQILYSRLQIESKGTLVKSCCISDRLLLVFLSTAYTQLEVKLIQNPFHFHYRRLEDLPLLILCFSPERIPGVSMTLMLSNTGLGSWAQTNLCENKCI